MSTIDIDGLETTSSSVLEPESEEVADVRWRASSKLDSEGGCKVGCKEGQNNEIEKYAGNTKRKVLGIVC